MGLGTGEHACINQSRGHLFTILAVYQIPYAACSGRVPWDSPAPPPPFESLKKISRTDGRRRGTNLEGVREGGLIPYSPPPPLRRIKYGRRREEEEDRMPRPLFAEQKQGSGKDLWVVWICLNCRTAGCFVSRLGDLGKKEHCTLSFSQEKMEQHRIATPRYDPC